MEALFTYLVKSMAGERVEVAMMGRGLAGDSRVACRRIDDRGGKDATEVVLQSFKKMQSSPGRP